MNLHEYQGKELLSSFGVRIQRGIVASSVEDAVAPAEKLNIDLNLRPQNLEPEIYFRLVKEYENLRR